MNFRPDQVPTRRQRRRSDRARDRTIGIIAWAGWIIGVFRELIERLP